MSKTVKGARIRHRRSDIVTDVPTIPPNDDHTTGWANTDIYVGEIFMNTNSDSPGMWFRNETGMTQLATYNSVSVTGITDGGTLTVSKGTQYVVVSGTCNGTVGYTVYLTQLETIINVVYISVDITVISGTLTVNINGSTGLVLSVTTTTGICLMWNGVNWIVISNT